MEINIQGGDAQQATRSAKDSLGDKLIFPNETWRRWGMQSKSQTNQKPKTKRMNPNQTSILQHLARKVRLVVLAATGFAAMSTLVAAPPANDDIANAVIVTEPLPFTHSVLTQEATSVVDDPVPSCAANGFTVWYVYTASADGHIRADTVGSDYDTVLSAYTGTPGNLTVAACNDDGASIWPSSRFLMPVSAGVTYYIMAGAWADTPGGNLVVNIETAPPPVVVELTFDEPVSVDPVTGIAYVTVHFRASSQVLLFSIGSFVAQGTGRGSVAAYNGKSVFDTVNSSDLVVPVFNQFVDRPYLRDQGTGFKGGKAYVRVDADYIDEQGVFRSERQAKEVLLTAGRARK